MSDTLKSASTNGDICGTAELWVSIVRFCGWLESVRGLSYDPYDIMGTRYGKIARRLYYEKSLLGMAMTAPLILLEIASPSLRGLFVKKDHFPTADAQLALAFLNIHELHGADIGGFVGDNKLGTELAQCSLDKAKVLAHGLLKQSIAGYSGYCWGYPFDWLSVKGLIPKSTPHITATPYCYEVFTKLFDLTGEQPFLDVARSIAGFVCNDLNDTPTGPDAAAGSYTPQDHSKVINATAYRAYVLFDAARRFQIETYHTKARRNLHFILQSQREDGSWLYAIDSPRESFIDHFHTCFVLKNLFKLNRELGSAAVKSAISGGYRYYREALFDGEDTPKSFAISPRTQIVRLEMYNMAESVTLGVLLRNDIPAAFELAQKLAARLVRRYQLPAGHWVTRLYLGGIKHAVPFLRWPQSQLFYALTNLLGALHEKSELGPIHSMATAGQE